MLRPRLLPVGDVLNRSVPTVARALQMRDGKAVARLVRRQLAAGAAALDLNAGHPGDVAAETAELTWLTATVRALTGVPLWIDTIYPEAAEPALTVARVGGQAVLNSLSLQPARFWPMLTLARRLGAGVVAQCLSDEGVPRGTEPRVRRARLLLDALLGEGFNSELITVDLCLLNHQIEPDCPAHVMQSVLRVRASHPRAHFTVGVRNFGWGLPRDVRRERERKALADLVEVGLDRPLLDATVVRLAALPVSPRT